MTLLLEPILIRTVKMVGTPEGSVRIVWITSLLHAGSPYMNFEDDGTPVVLAKLMDNYMQSKVGAAWLGDKFAKRLGDQGILSVVSIPWVGWR
jgi:retinol dehydrogenase 12